MGRWLERLATNPVLQQGVSNYFLSKAPLSAASHYLLTLAMVLFVIWPKSQYLHVGSPPLTFSILAIVATLIMSYLSFSYGAGQSAQDATPLSWASMVGEETSGRRVVYGLTVLTVAHTLFCVILGLPLLIAAAHVSGVSLANFTRALLLMITCTLAYRWLGVLTLCLWEKQEFMRYAVVRLAFVVLVLASALFLPALNPLLGLISLSFGEQLGQLVQVFGRSLSYATVSLIIHLLLLLAAYIIARYLLLSRLDRLAASGLAGRGGSLNARRTHAE